MTAAIDGSSQTSSDPLGVWAEYPGISYSGEILLDNDDVEYLETNDVFEGVVQTIMGSIIGVG